MHCSFAVLVSSVCFCIVDLLKCHIHILLKFSTCVDLLSLLQCLESYWNAYCINDKQLMRISKVTRNTRVVVASEDNAGSKVVGLCNGLSESEVVKSVLHNYIRQEALVIWKVQSWKADYHQQRWWGWGRPNSGELDAFLSNQWDGHVCGSLASLMQKALEWIPSSVGFLFCCIADGLLFWYFLVVVDFLVIFLYFIIKLSSK